MDHFIMNGKSWDILFVNPDDPMLVDRTGKIKVATTDPETSTVRLSERLIPDIDFLNHVLIHELGHCALFSFHLIDDIHRTVYPEYWIEAEEWVCNFLADYGLYIFDIAYSVLGQNAWKVIPYELEKMIA